MKVLVIGSGGREHALSERISKSKLVEKVYVAPGNGGTARNPKCSNVPIPANQYEKLVQFGCENKIDLVVPGPEQALVDGIENYFRRVGIPCFGPTERAARLEGSKAFSKEFMTKHSIPTAEYRNFNEFNSAKKYLQQINHKVVIKASGLAAGKGVIIPESPSEAIEALEAIMVRKEFGSSGNEVVIEEFLEGQEISLLTISDGYTVLPLSDAQDHKRIYEGDKGPNTGGMGAYAPTPVASSNLLDSCLKKIIQPTIDGMRRDGMPFVGCLFTGLMITDQGPKVLEYNVRFGDPETQTVLNLLSEDTDLAQLLLACCERHLDSVNVHFKSAHSVTVVVASPGYPDSYPKGIPISIEESALPKNSFIYHAGTILDKENCLRTAGGRVLAVNAIDSTLEAAVERAYAAVNCIRFDGMVYRKDIAHRALNPTINVQDKKNPLTYMDSGVSIDAGNELVKKIKPIVRKTARPGSDSVIGGFGGLFDLKSVGYVDPVIVSGTDGVGTKLIIAQKSNKHDTVGIDLVAMSVNDLLVQGAEPLFFLDYFACSRLEVHTAVDVIGGIATGCQQSGCALIGGETAEMPGLYQNNDYDLAGFAVGVVERSDVLPRLREIQPGDALIGLSSSGFHSNGFSLVRKVVEKSGLSLDSPCPWSPERRLDHALLDPTRIYTCQVLPLLKSKEKLVKGMSHITGGGFLENLPRVLPEGLGCQINAESYPLPDSFRWLMQQGNIEPLEMCRTFNCGIGMVLIVAKESAGKVISLLNSETSATAALKTEAKVYQIGIVNDKPGVKIEGLDSWLA
ncbi:phosphoribosylformylglycinamidine cyclo-ligase [Phakopsora pachyrhizi]|uniref:Phosphoribosylformylglycinamidine cyclo-ligase n=1 Tax=Phakopsora pachyrhizi TaxID=170000 RepID=A0AAV0BQG6_PHAPC|nr:phosphoribosylformylglycinamidine cyclo-ligase [Phakopsora pachyrhizi]CAH7689604.1 phosphoribosylformylglycinamidine cyclo-ligase [Phakopsora pachyrhizi]